MLFGGRRVAAAGSRRLPTLIHCEVGAYWIHAANHGGVSSSPAGRADLPDDERNRLEASIKKREEDREGLLAVVEVRVYEHHEVPYITFPPDALLGVESDPSAI
jgi:hypothetical protein